MKKKILLASHEMTYTGAPQSLLRITDVLLNNGYEVDVWALCDGPLKKEYISKGVKVTVVAFPEKQEQYISKIKEYDLVIANTLFCAKFAWFAQQHVRTVLYIREAQNIPWLMEKNAIDPNWLVDAKNIVCVSEYAKEFIEVTYGLQNITVIHNFIDDYSAQEAASSDDIIDFIVSGTIEPRKGQDVAIKAFLCLPEELRKKAKLHIVGNMPVWAEDYHKRLQLGTHESVIYHGEYRDREKLYELYRNMDVFMVTSTDESCSLVALEAAMLGKPLLVTENTGAKYMVPEECVLPTGDEKTLSSSMEDCIRHPEKWSKFGKGNRERYLLYANRKSYEKALLSYIGEVMEKEEIISENKIKVSVVVPVYNVEQYLVQCMESLVNQTLQEIEIICVNDGSKDGSLDILREYEQKDHRVRVISGENHGYGHAMNTGIDAAKGEFLGIVEPDDYADLHMFETLYQRATATGVDIVKADFYRFFGEGDEQRNVYNSTARVPENYNHIINPKKDKECFRFIMNTWSGIYRMDFLNQYRIRHNETPGASFQDNGFWFQGFCRTEKITFINKPLLYNRRDNPNSSVNNREKIYCANEEYAYIRQFLRDNPELEKDFLPQFLMKKYHTYMFTLNRVGWQYKQEFLQRFAEEFKQAEEQGELCKAAFTPQEWTNLHWIMNNPEEYYEKVVKKEIEISVIIPVYNTEKYLRQCLESLETQSFTRFEVICVDDGSTDGSKQIIEGLMNRDKRFSLVTQQNQGAGAARNRGMELAKGEYLLFLDADDYFAPDMLLHAWQKIRETEADICVMNSWQHDEETGMIQPCNYALRIDAYPGWRPFRVQDMGKNPFRNFMGWAWDKLYLKRFIMNNNLKFQEQRTSNDMYFTYMSLFKADRITTLDERLIYQRRNIPGSLSKTREKSWECFYNALMAMKQELVDMGLYERNSIYFVNYALHSCLWNLKTLPEETAQKLWVKIEDEWADSLRIRRMKESEAEFSAEYEDYQLIVQKGNKGLKAVREKYRTEQEQAKKNAKKQSFSPPEAVSANEAAEYQVYVNKIRNSKLFQVALKVFKWLIKVRRKIKGMWRNGK
ncbi:MAG: glycosyltransferase [Lachnospiraceae bacterium]|nr:glycosyltransferase [Lachnospiraceae bacterium]